MYLIAIIVHCLFVNFVIANSIQVTIISSSLLFFFSSHALELIS